MMGQGHRADGEINGAKDPRLTTTAGIADAAANADAAMVEDVKTTKPIEAAEAKRWRGRHMLLLRAERTHQAELSQEVGHLQAVQPGGPPPKGVQIIGQIW